MSASAPVQAIDPVTGAPLPEEYPSATAAEVDEACRRAADAFEVYRATPAAVRAELLRAVARGLETEAAEIIERAHRESALPLARLQGEMGRTCTQLRLFATVLDEGSWVEARIDTADPARQPLPKPDVRSMRRPLGPVAVFGASNFPLAFSVAGGDTAAALASGNPVLAKAHPAHPGTCARVGRVLAAAVHEAGLPAGVFTLLFDAGYDVGSALVRHPQVAAVAFTGSRAGGEALMRLAASRPRPIPVYAEMGSVNPVLILPGALAARGPAIAAGLHGSFTLGVGQFCTNPGVVLLEEGAAGDAFLAALAEKTASTASGAMLTPGICRAYQEGQDHLAARGAERVAQGAEGTAATGASAALWQVAGARALAEPELLEEVFGPSTLAVRYRDRAQLESLLRSLEGNLTATVHAEPAELQEIAPLLHLLETKAGRLLINQFPTGVEVCPAMVHGGPFPATSDGRSTSVGTRAIERFTRFVAWQGFPQDALPPELQDGNPLGIWRLVDGAWGQQALFARR
ncbi:MAG TPA: aldehyde dehydrogenase (NADP(+)) [Acidobacteria bacterium]|nr:aldehyde dehydrogenase (NADP(+)) [Acidobacteriota bacterium]